MSAYKNRTSAPTSTAPPTPTLTRASASTSTTSRPEPKHERGDTSPVSEQSDQDGDIVESPADEVVADYNVKLGKDDREAIDPSNILSERTRHAKPINGSYILPDDDDDDDDDEEEYGEDVMLREDETVVSADAASLD
ncbi:uncharacterized protein F4812DRAFT_462716 [Daldinia caldariorum]|uniref:uncharacterized protein n=1 Tax=Daldinia caldariorum TaxID=326644 RepID=UPI00200839CC|nr:uncharacterized protein F4812DRAFT_462716 [Daldinia caldariorum]KAI1464301.1 hypothetical protein F4812DRAFT_462716 [Daldinia caldariorum]